VGDPHVVWAQEIIGLGFDVLEKLVGKLAGQYAVVHGEVTLADIVLVPAVEGALARRVSIVKTSSRVWREASSVDEGHCAPQGDTQTNSASPDMPVTIKSTPRVPAVFFLRSSNNASCAWQPEGCV